MHNIDNEQSVFHLHTYTEPLASELSDSKTSCCPAGIVGVCVVHRALPSSYANMSESDDTTVLPASTEAEAFSVVQTLGKGKATTKPVHIRPHTGGLDSYFDQSSRPASDPIYSQSNSNFDPSLSSLISPSLDRQTADDALDRNDSGYPDNSIQMLDPSSDEPPINAESFIGKGKGKERELPPSLPPLNFSPTEFIYNNTEWPSPPPITPTPGPSSYGSGHSIFSIPISNTNPPPIQTHEADHVSAVTANLPTLKRVPSRRRSLSNLSVQSERSIAARSLSRIKMRFGGTQTPSNLARRLLFRKREEDSDLRGNLLIDHDVDALAIDADFFEGGGCLGPWRKDSKARPKAPPPSPVPHQGQEKSFPLYLSNRGSKIRSYSSPLPFSALDYVPAVSTDIFVPIPIVIRNYFDEVLPRELRLHIFASLIALHQGDYERLIRENVWTVSKASSPKGRWVGRDKGIRELVKLSRVSKSWQSLVLDGQLWTDLDLHSFPRMPASFVTRLADVGGAFIQSLDISGHSRLLPTTLLDVTNRLCLQKMNGTLPYTQLTTINIQGCSALTTRSLDHLLIRSPSLEKLCVKGLDAVTNTTCDVLAAYCPLLVSLDMSRCANVSGDAIRALAAAAISRGEHLLLKELRLSGLKHIDDAVMATLGRAAPYLEVLDLSYVRHLHNSAIEAFVSCDGGDYDRLGVETIQLTAREVGRDLGDMPKCRRRLTHLRHLSLSSCVLLTDIACANLAYTVPMLEFLELGGIGAELKDDGLIRLLNTTPFIKRLDLEDASDITDAVLATLTPSAALEQPISVANRSRVALPDPETGHALEHLIISHAAELTEDAILRLVRKCMRLRVLEADNTRVSASVFKEFVRLSRKRRMDDSRIVAIDCRGIGEGLIKELSGSTRPRKGWASHEARKLKYVDARDGVVEDLKIGQDECDKKRVVVKTFYSWQTVDSVAAAREKRRKSTSRRAANDSMTSTEDDDRMARSTRWWSPSGRRSGSRSGTNSPPALIDGNNDREGCRLM